MKLDDILHVYIMFIYVYKVEGGLCTVAVGKVYLGCVV